AATVRQGSGRVSPMPLRRQLATAAGLAMCAGLALAAPAWGDRIILKSGGEIRGVVVPDASQPNKVSVQTETSARPVVFAKSQVAKIQTVSSKLDDYLARRSKLASTAEAEYQLGVWCEENKLLGPAEIQYRRAVAIDENHALAHKKLGHVL